MHANEFENSQIDFRMPPQSIPAEEEIIGGLLVDPNAISRVAHILPPEAFYYSAHAEIYRVILSLHHEDRPIDLMAITFRLADLGLLDKVGGKKQLVDLFDRCISAVNIDVYAELVLEKYKRRKLIQICREIIAESYKSTSWQEVYSAAESKIFAFSEASSQQGFVDLGDLLCSAWSEMEAEKDSSQSVLTGFYDLDNFTQGLKPGQLVIVGGRPSMGKSAFATAIALNVAQSGRPVGVFSLEMSGVEIAKRVLAEKSETASSRMSSSDLDPDEWGRLGQALTSLVGLPIAVDESSVVTPTTILSRCRRLKSERKDLGVVIIDYLHLMLDDAEDEVRELGKITRACKKMARSLNVPIILLSQLSRAVEERSNKRPTLRDLRQSGAIEQDADIVMFLYRDEYYNPDTPDRGIAEVIVAKNRNGATGTVKLLFQPEYTRFLNIARGRYE